MDIVTTDADLVSVVLNSVEKERILVYRGVCRLWRDCLRVAFEKSLKDTRDYMNSMRRMRFRRIHHPHNARWYDPNPGYNYMFDPSRDHIYQLGTCNLLYDAAEEDRRCCAFTRRGNRCQRSFSNTSRLCFYHHRGLFQMFAARRVD